MNLREPDLSRVISALKVLGEANRLRILCELGLECCPVTNVINATGLRKTNVSFHLRMLREAGFVRAERRGPFIFYCLADPELPRIPHALTQWLGARQVPGAGESNPPSQPTKRHSAGARIREVL